MESEIFGYNKGAFTGAASIRIGKLEIADKGTVFFDDIDSLDINMQAKLFRVIQESEYIITHVSPNQKLTQMDWQIKRH